MSDLEKFYDKIYRYCFMKLHNPQIAEDITQETFLHYLKAEGKGEIKNLESYLYAVARNLCVDFYRIQPLESIANEKMIGTDDCEWNSTRLVLEQAMEDLPDDEREVLFLRYTNGVSVNEIAKIIGVSRFSVYRKEKHALKVLRDKLDRRDFYED